MYPHLQKAMQFVHYCSNVAVLDPFPKPTSSGLLRIILQSYIKGPKYLVCRKHGFFSRNFKFGLDKYPPPLWEWFMTDHCDFPAFA